MENKKQEKEALNVILGANGALGSAIVRELAKDGKRVRCVVRNTIHANKLFEGLNIEIFQADILEYNQLEQAVQGATVVYHCVGIPYTKWLKLFPKIQDNIVKVLTSSDSILVYADNLYMYGKMNGEEITEKHPHLAQSKKGMLRSKLANELLELHTKGDLQVVIARFGDFFGPNVVNGFSLPLFKNPLKNKPASWIGNLDQKHSLIYIDDAAKGIISLAQQPEMYGQVWHIDGAEAVTGREFITLVFEQLDKKPKMKVLKKGTIAVLGTFIPLVKEIHELLDQWEKPFIINGDKFASKIDGYSTTPHTEAIQETLGWFEANQ
jgi:nucleoside-diphosphate-sugar epimerase